jgi:flavin reductase (DIM6/NTAB) family NADH-FMN oxidoreductase RutF
MAATSVDLRNVVKDFPAGVTIVTSTDRDGQPVGATVSAFSSLSLNPPLVLVCLTMESRSANAIRHSQAFVVHLLAEHQAGLAQHFAGDIAEKFADVTFERNEAGVPCLDDCPVRLECSLHAELPGGDHAIFVGRVEAAFNEDGFQPVVHSNRKFSRLADLDPASA